MLMSSAVRQDEASHVADCFIAYALGICSRAFGRFACVSRKLCGGVTAKAFLVCVGILTVLVAVACSGVC